MIISFRKCWTGRRWINIGKGLLAIGFGPKHFIEFICWNHKYIYPPRLQKARDENAASVEKWREELLSGVGKSHDETFRHRGRTWHP